MRCFIAIEIPQHIKARIFHEFENLKGKNLLRGKFVEKENFHLTLKFLGKITNEEIEKIKKGLREIKFKRFEGYIGKTGFFNDEKHIKLIWVDLVSNELNELQRQIDKATFVIKNDSKKFDSHLTAVRVKSVINELSLIKEVKRIHFKNLDFEIKEFVLMKSELYSEGPKYKVLDKFQLKKYN